MNISSKELNDTSKIAKDLLTQIGSSNVICLIGQMGAGKTTFTQELAKHLGIESAVISPTFILMREHTIKNGKFKRLYHVDLYRLESVEEAEGLGLSEIWSNKENLVIIEWPEKISHVLPKDRIELNIEVVNPQERIFKYETIH